MDAAPGAAEQRPTLVWSLLTGQALRRPEELSAVLIYSDYCNASLASSRASEEPNYTRSRISSPEHEG